MEVNFRNLFFDNKSFGPMAFLCKVLPYYRYENNEKTEELLGFKYTTAFPALSFATMDIKIEGPQQMDMSGADYIPVKFDGLKVKLYFDDRGQKYRLTAKAEGIHKVDEKRT